MYEYWAIVKSVHDGDTITVDIDQGFNDWKHNQHLRIAGISARELDMLGGPEAATNLGQLLPVATKIRIRSVKLEHDPADDISFDRYVMTVELPLPSMEDLGGYLVRTGWAAIWNGKTRPIPYPAWPRVQAA